MYFADTSAVAKLYVAEAGSAWLRSLRREVLAVSALVVPEMGSVLARLQREHVLDEMEGHTIWEHFISALNRWEITRVGEPILRRAASLLLDNVSVPLRTLDAIQVASALEVQDRARRTGASPLVLLTADSRLEAAARQFGLDTDNPNRHQ